VARATTAEAEGAAAERVVERWLDGAKRRAAEDALARGACTAAIARAREAAADRSPGPPSAPLCSIEAEARLRRAEEAFVEGDPGFGLEEIDHAVFGFVAGGAHDRELAARARGAELAISIGAWSRAAAWLEVASD